MPQFACGQFAKDIMTLSASSLHDVNILVGTGVSNPTLPDLATFTSCATYAGVAPTGSFNVDCSQPVVGNVLALQIAGTSEILQLCEVIIYTTICKYLLK